ncbi:MAG TPA: alpha/beta fold hydrolase, partial [Candidatus Thermoplasmatota archaeon]|nr:alpha/beta fold hydrolase [Candidatus Thermoplasmatota archaeon]
ALPQGDPLGIVVLAHGYGHTAESHRGHLERLASLGHAAVAMDYRGEGMPLRAGADDTIAATRDLMQRYPGKPVVLYSVSMGTAVAGIVLAELPVFDWWVNNEGLSDLPELHTEASLLAPANAFAAKAVADMDAECGGTPAQRPACYQERSAALRAGEFRHLKGVVLAHGLNDGLVPYDQGRQMQAALRAAGIPQDFYTVVRGNVGGEGTTITGYAGRNVDGLAGHGTESNDAHALTALSFALLERVLDGSLVPGGREVVVDRDLGALP